jgi:ABC-type nitrate/sulfonate/bicarbonate transport system substrate-binding protein
VGFGSPSPLFTPVYIADERGFFAQNGLDVEVLHMSGSIFVQASASGELQVGAISSSAAIAGIARGAPLRIVAGLVERPDWVLLARQGAGIQGPADLKGKRVLITGFGGATHQMMAILAERYGWQLPQDAMLLPVSSSDGQMATLQQGEADALVVSRERALGFQARGVGTIVFEFADLVPEWLDYVLVAHTDTIARNPAAVQRTLRAVFQSVQYMSDHPQEVAERLVTIHQQSPDIAAQVAERLLYTPDGRIDPRALETVMQTLVKIGALDAPPRLDELYTSQFTPVSRQ